MYKIQANACAIDVGRDRLHLIEVSWGDVDGSPGEKNYLTVIDSHKLRSLINDTSDTKVVSCLTYLPIVAPINTFLGAFIRRATMVGTTSN